MTSCDKRLEELLNRAGQTISDISNKIELSDGENLIDYATASRGRAQSSVLHLTDIIDRMEWALKNLLNIYDRQTHIIANVDAPEGLTQEQYYKAVEAIIEALDKYRAGLEPWDDWGFEDAEKV